MNAGERFQELFEKADAAGEFESYLTEDGMARFEVTADNWELANLLTGAGDYAYRHNDATAGDRLTAMAELVKANPDADFSA